MLKVTQNVLSLTRHGGVLKSVLFLTHPFCEYIFKSVPFPCGLSELPNSPTCLCLHSWGRLTFGCAIFHAAYESQLTFYSTYSKCMHLKIKCTFFVYMLPSQNKKMKGGKTLRCVMSCQTQIVFLNLNSCLIQKQCFFWLCNQ